MQIYKKQDIIKYKRRLQMHIYIYIYLYITNKFIIYIIHTNFKSAIKMYYYYYNRITKTCINITYITHTGTVSLSKFWTACTINSCLYIDISMHTCKSVAFIIYVSIIKSTYYLYRVLSLSCTISIVHN